METNSADYYRHREARQQALADAATSPAIAAIHRDMVRQYRDRIEQATSSSRG